MKCLGPFCAGAVRDFLLQGLLLAVIGLAFWAGPTHAAQDPDAIERQIKAAYLFNFAKFVTWPTQALPTNPSVPFRIGILADRPFYEEVKRAVSGKSIGEHPFTVELLSDADQASRCQILFVGAAAQANVAQILSQLRAKPVLTVSDLEHFTQKGGAVRFFPHENARHEKTLLFEINAEAAREGGLKISSKLLQLSKHAPDR